MKDQHHLPICLIITSDPSKKSHFKQALKSLFYVIDTPTAFSAIDWLKNMAVEMIVLDEKSLDHSFEEVCKLIRGLTGYEHTPILLITGKLKKEFSLRAIHAGITDFILEPLDEAEIYQRVLIAITTRGVSKKMGLIAAKIKESATLTKTADKLSHRVLLSPRALEEIQKIKKEQELLSLLMLQIDALEKIDATCGSAVAEELSEAVRMLLLRHLRAHDTLFLQGGGRFLLFLPKTSSRAASVIGKMIQEEIQRTTFSAQKKEFSLTVSMGITSLEKKLEGSEGYAFFDSLLDRVGLCLKEAQKHGDKIVSK